SSSTSAAVVSTPSLAAACTPGARFPSFFAMCQADARPWQLHHIMPSDGRFRIVVFGGDITSAPTQLSVVNAFGAYISDVLLPKYRTLELSPGADPHGGRLAFKRSDRDKGKSVVDVLLVHCGEREKVE